MSKCVLIQAAALLLVFIAGGQGQSQPPVRPSPTTRPPPPRNCSDVFQSCSADRSCAALYARFQRNCATELASKPANCSQECQQIMNALAAHRLGADLHSCDCGSQPVVSDACRTSRDNLLANCFPSPGTPLKCGSSCTEARGRCFQNRECGALLTSIRAKCSNISVWNGRGDLPACNSDCRDALNRLSKLPNAIEMECCDCGEDVSCAMFQAKIAAACPSLRNCKRDCPRMPPMCPTEPRPPPPRQSCSHFFANCSQCRDLILAQATACQSVFAWDGQGTPPTCPEACMAANLAFGTLPNAREVACCDCGEGFIGRECSMRKMKLAAACGLDDIDCDSRTEETCPVDDDNDDDDDHDRQRPLMCQDILSRCPQFRPLMANSHAACKAVLEWNGIGNPPMCPEACVNVTRAMKAAPNAKRVGCCDCGEGPLGMQCRMAKLKLGAACGNAIDCRMKPPMCPPRRRNCTSVVMDCPECGPLLAAQRAACRSVFEWNGRGDPPNCTEECATANRAFGALPNLRELTCCDCGEGAYGRECRLTRMKFEAACGKSDIDCDGTTDRTCPLDRDDDDDDRQRPLMCHHILSRCPQYRELAHLQLNVCKSVLDWSGQGTPPMCPTACMNNLDTLRTLPNVRRFACCDCGEGSQGMLCRTERRKIETACGSSGFDCRDNAEETCPLDGDRDDDDNRQRPLMCHHILSRCPQYRELVHLQLNVCKSVLDWSGQGTPPMCPTACMNNLDTLRTLPNVRRFACCDCGEGRQGMLCRTERRKIETACGSSGFDCNEMCPSRPRPHGVVDCYTAEGVCARNSTCAQLKLAVLECVTDTGYKNSSDCNDARMELHDYLMRAHHGMPFNCTCITSPVQCSKLQSAIFNLPKVEPPVCNDARDQCNNDATCKALLEGWKTSCANLKGKKVKTCDARCTGAGSMLRQNILGSRAWQCLKGNNNKTIKTRYVKLCLD